MSKLALKRAVEAAKNRRQLEYLRGLAIDGCESCEYCARAYFILTGALQLASAAAKKPRKKAKRK